GCVVPTLERRIFGPGERGMLKADIKSTSQPSGNHTWFIKVHYRAGEAKGSRPQVQSAQLRLEAIIRNEVTVEPGVLVWSGTGILQHEVVVTDLRTPPLTVTRLHFTSPLVQAQIKSADRGITRIELKTNTAIPPGRNDEMLSIFTNDPVYSHFQLPVTL